MSRAATSSPAPSFPPLPLAVPVAAVLHRRLRSSQPLVARIVAARLRMKRSRRAVERLNVARSSKVREGRGDPGCWVWRAIEGSSGGRGAFVPCIGGFCIDNISGQC